MATTLWVHVDLLMGMFGWVHFSVGVGAAAAILSHPPVSGGFEAGGIFAPISGADISGAIKGRWDFEPTAVDALTPRSESGDAGLQVERVLDGVSEIW